MLRNSKAIEYNKEIIQAIKDKEGLEIKEYWKLRGTKYIMSLFLCTREGCDRWVEGPAVIYFDFNPEILLCYKCQGILKRGGD